MIVIKSATRKFLLIKRRKRKKRKKSVRFGFFASKTEKGMRKKKKRDEPNKGEMAVVFVVLFELVSFGLLHLGTSRFLASGSTLTHVG